MKTNVKTPAPRTHGGSVAARITPEQELRRTVMACLLWETEAYESGVKIADRIAALVPQVDPFVVATIAVQARTEQHLRHVPLLIVREMCRHKKHLPHVANTLEAVCQRADEPAEFLSLYWAGGKCPVAKQVKLGLARAFGRFGEYNLAKYNRDGAVKLRDVMFICHPKPCSDEQAALFKKVAENNLATPDTWEVELSASTDKKASWTRLLDEKVLGAMALLRNLRNMTQAGVDEQKVRAALKECKPDRVLPFRFVTAAQHNPRLEPELEELMFKCLAGREKLPGKTVLIVDVSGSMGAKLSLKSELRRFDVAAALCMLARELCEQPVVYATAGDDYRRVHATLLLPARRGFAMRDAVIKAANSLGGGGIFLHQCMEYIARAERSADRIIVLTDEQDCDLVNKPTSCNPWGITNYLINVASAKNGIGYGEWRHIDGWSEACLDYIQAVEESNN